MVIALCVFAFDRLTKSLVSANVPFGTEVAVIDHVVDITNVHNSGAAFGFAPAFARLGHGKRGRLTGRVQDWHPRPALSWMLYVIHV